MSTITEIQEESKLKKYIKSIEWKEKGIAILFFFLMYVGFFILYSCAAILNQFVLKTRISKDLSQQFNILEHKVEWPADKSNPIFSLILFGALVIGSILTYLIYSKYLDRKEKTNPIENFRHPSCGKKVIAAIGILLINIFIFFKDKLETALNKSLSGSIGVYITIFVILLILGILSNLSAVMRLNTIKGIIPTQKEDIEGETKLDKEDINTDHPTRRILGLLESIWSKTYRKRTLILILSISLMTLIITVINFSITFVSPHMKALAQWDWSPITAGEDKITLLSNKGNMLILSMVVVLIFGAFFKFFIPLINKKYGSDLERADAEEGIKNRTVGSNFLFFAKAIGIGLLGNVIISLMGSLEKVKSIGALFIITALITLVAIVNVISEVRVYIPNKLTEASLGKQSRNDITEIIPT